MSHLLGSTDVQEAIGDELQFISSQWPFAKLDMATLQDLIIQLFLVGKKKVTYGDD
ncbi:MAG: hypothetical protein ACJ8AG_12525 [Ktedonobacteraceae bacterium]